VTNHQRFSHHPDTYPDRPSPVVCSLLMWGPTEALVNHVTTEFQHQGELLEEAKRHLAETRLDLEVYKKAFSIAERDRRDLEERFEHEKQALNDEIRQLKERAGMYDGEGMFEQEKQALNDGILQLKVRLFPDAKSWVPRTNDVNGHWS